MELKCPICGSTDIVMEANVRIRFKHNESGAITIISDYADIIEELKDCEFDFVCGECFEKREENSK